MVMEKNKILLVDAKKDVLQLGKKILCNMGFNLVIASNAGSVMKMVAVENPRVLIIEADLPGRSGFEISRKLKNDIVTHQISIIISTSSADDGFVKKVIEAGADDFIVKPFDPVVMNARVQMVLERGERERHCNPVTGLADNTLIENNIERKIKEREKFAVCYVDINNFRQYNLKYGFSSGDDVIKTTGKIIKMVLRRFPNHDYCLGHSGENHFVFITDVDIVENVCTRIIETFDEVVPSLYDSVSSKRGYIHMKNRSGKVDKTPLMTLAMGVITNQHRLIEHISVISDVAGELKRYAKTFSDSIFVVDRRK